MKILLKKDVETLGYAGEVHDVKPGYGRNYLIPQGVAVKATPGVLRAAESWRKLAEVRRDQIRKEHEALVARINNVSLDFTAKAGEQGKLYGSITTAAITEELERSLGIELDRRKIDSPPLRQVGQHQVTVILSKDYRARVTVNIQSEEEEEIAGDEEVEIAGDEEVMLEVDEAVLEVADEEVSSEGEEVDAAPEA